MTRKIADGNLRFRIQGLAHQKGKVAARVFASKLNSLVSAIAAADKSVNGRLTSQLIITELKAASASVWLREAQLSSKSKPASGLELFAKWMLEDNAPKRHEFEDHYVRCLKHVRSLCVGVSKNFDHAELEFSNSKRIRIDPSFSARIENTLSRVASREANLPRWFQGVVDGVFDGRLMESDLRQEIPRVILVLSSGGNQIPGLCEGMTATDIRPHLGNRVRVTGTAHYDGTSGLPAKIHIRAFSRIKEESDFLKWQSSFRPFDIDYWDGD